MGAPVEMVFVVDVQYTYPHIVDALVYNLRYLARPRQRFMHPFDNVTLHKTVDSRYHSEIDFCHV